ncbi:MAG TPA: hypothetical protein VGY77_06125 [Gemmataceae bacterium]|nr:hypothetical protein [Gemmataceae bacterium]
MNTQFEVTPYTTTPIQVPKDTTPTSEAISLLRQMVEIQKDQLGLARAAASAQDLSARWRTFFGRWREDFPDLAGSCREVLPILERTFATLLSELLEQLRENSTGSLENDFTLQEFLDRHGMRLAQLGTMLNLIGPMAEAGSPGSG